MKILPITDPAFKPYGRIVEGYPVDGILAALAVLEETCSALAALGMTREEIAAKIRKGGNRDA